MNASVIVLWDVATDEAIILGVDGLCITLPDREAAREWLDRNQYAPPDTTERERRVRNKLLGPWFKQAA